MSHFVFVLGEYYPVFSANGLCAYNIAEKIAEKHEVTVICQKMRPDERRREVFHRQSIRRVSYPLWDLRITLQKGKNARGLFRRTISSLLYVGVQATEYIQFLVSRHSLRNGFVRSFYRELNSLEKSPDVIIPLCFPMEAVYAAMKYKKKRPGIPLLPYLLDPFSDNHVLHRTDFNKKLKMKRHLMLERSMLEASSRVFCAFNLMDHYVTQFGEHSWKLVSCEHPLMKEYVSLGRVHGSGGPIRLLYTGAFDRIIRNPKYFLKAIHALRKKMDLRCDIYANGNCDRLIRMYSDDPASGIAYHGFVSKEKILKAIEESDILLAVGNMDNLQVPSKVIEYMSYGKPIVLFYSNEGDANLLKLKKYPLSLCLREEKEKLHENVSLLRNFILKEGGKHLEYRQVEDCFIESTPEYVASAVMKGFEDSLRRN
jgi:glycosyltransferase involved in cell wall biosynthesis